MVILDVVIALILDVRIDTSTHSWCVLVVVAPVVYSGDSSAGRNLRH